MLTDLNFPIKGKTALEIALYFGLKTETVETAIRCGSQTYQDIWDYAKRERKQEHARARLIEKSRGIQSQ